jgi:SAM-dependent methyltransferase
MRRGFFGVATPTALGAATVPGRADRYFIKSGYTENCRAQSFDEDGIEAFWSEERRRTSAIFQYHVYALSRRLARERSGVRLMDVGCGPGVKLESMLQSVCKEICVVDQPSLAPLVSEILPDSRFVPANLESIDDELDDRFDLILCVDVLEHLHDPNPCMAFIRRHLAVGGAAILSTPERDHLRGRDCTSCEKPEHVREWNGAEFRRYVEHSGFSVVDQLLFPQIRLSLPEFGLSRLLAPTVENRRWSSCQVVVAERGPDPAIGGD